MSDHDQPARGEHEPAFEDPAYDDVRALLADARVTEPVPAEVVARLDATLSALRDQRRTEADRASVVSLRGRRAGRILAAAAAVVLIGAGGASLVRNAGDGSTAADSTAAGAADQHAGADSASDSGGAEKSAPSARQPQFGSLDTLSATRLRTDHFARDAAAAMRVLSGEAVAADKARTSSGESPGDVPATPPEATGKSQLTTGSGALRAPPVTQTPARDDAQDLADASICGGPPVTDGVTLPATLDGAPVALVFRPPTADAQLVEAWSCDGSALLASASVPH